MEGIISSLNQMGIIAQSILRDESLLGVWVVFFPKLGGKKKD